ncbi:MAG: SusD/RagB family nutrient-binding outer membrane lipoprotein [Tannerellaceae bacterium]|nr:SusD/RagB family nutrient-binding outer membrane lipoprotein [Tannerellaceae bacterium]
MKTNKWIYPAILLLMCIGCTDLTELNENPTKSTNMPAELLIPTVQLAHSQDHQTVHRFMAYPGGFINHWTADYGSTEHGGKGKKNISYMERMWIHYYPNIVKNVTALVSLTKEEEELVNIHAMGRILQVETFMKITDYYGDIPYFEAGKIYQEGIIKPVYDKQEDIYMDFLKELSEASAQLDPARATPQYDLYYNGDIEKWRRFANSLWLRVAMRLVKANPEKAQQEAKAAYQAGLMQSNDDICFVQHETSTIDAGPGNGFANRLLASPEASNFRMTDDLKAALEGDPRLLFIGGCYLNDVKRTNITDLIYERLGELLAVPSQEFLYGGGVGSETVWAPAITADVDGQEVNITHHYQRIQPSHLITASESAYLHLTYAETQFFLAEAAVRGWNISPESAETHYKRGLEAAIKQWSLFNAPLPSQEAISAFVNVRALDTGTDALEEINKQLWILYVLDPFEAWSNIRRTGMPSEYTTFYNRYPQENESDGKMPRRMQYPLEEQVKNAQNLQVAIERLGGSDDWTKRVWWDK